MKTLIFLFMTLLTVPRIAGAQIPAAAAFSNIIDGKACHLYILENSSSMKAAITNYGGRLVSLIIPAKDGKPTDVVAGFDNIEGYVHSTEPYFGATIGRYGNRIAKGKFTIDGKAYQITINNGPNALHGGKKGFQSVVWDARQINPHTLELHYISKDGEEGFPGNLHVKVTYMLTHDNALSITYEATTDKTTVVNLTNHAFFNLNGWGNGNILSHTLQINADQYTPVNETLIPTGQLAPVAGTPFDFRKGMSIGGRINDHSPQLQNGKGYDHNFVLNKHHPATRVATVKGNLSGIFMSVYTDQPGLQFYSGNFMAAKNHMKGNTRDNYRSAFALETQHFPDSPNEPGFPSTVLQPGEVYRTRTCYRFTHE